MQRRFLLSLSLALLCSLAPAQSSPTSPIDDIANATSQIGTELQSIRNLVSSLNLQISQDQGTIQTAQQTIATDISTIAGQASQISSLEQQLATAQQASSSAVPSAILSQLPGLQKLSGWALAPGTAANTAQGGSTGTATWTSNPDGSSTIAIAPNGAWYDAFYHRTFAGAGTSVPMPNLITGLVLYRNVFKIDAANMPLSQALEMDSSWYYPANRYQCAGQIQMGTKTFRYYDPGIPNWVDTKIAVPIAAGQPMPVEILCKFDVPNAITTYVGVSIAGTYHPLNIQVKPRAKTTAAPYAHTSVQLDSNGKGAPYSASVDQTSIGYL